VKCSQQYRAWKTGPARPVARKFDAALRRFTVAANADDIPLMIARLRKVGPLAARLAAYPMPRCADPAGDYGQLLTRLQAAADNVRSASGISAIMLANVPLKAVPGIERRLSAELRRDAGVKP
jgi:hypothetical protein